ncbi:MAG: enoyl-CoA hydratase-related protein [Pseudomonadota bacterium]
METAEGVGRIIFDRERQKNAFALEMYAGYAAALSELDQNDQVMVIVVSGEGADFCAGNDLEDFIDPEFELETFGDPAHSAPARAVHALANLGKPLLGAVEGWAIGFGATMLLHFDYVALAENSQLLYPFVDIGIVPEAGASVLLGAQVGRRKAIEMLLDPKPVPSAKALELGLASTQTPAGEALTHVLEVAQRWAARPVPAMTRAKALLKGDVDALRQRIDEEFRQMGASLLEPSTQQRLRAMHKRSSGSHK